MSAIQKEIDCIKKARKIEASEVQKKIDGFITVKKFIVNQFSFKGIKNNTSDLNTLPKYLFYIFITTTIVIFLPFTLIVIYFYSQHKVNKLKKEIADLQSDFGKNTPVPSIKSLASLWGMYGLQNLKSTHLGWFYNLSDSKLQIGLIDEWINTLYGIKIANSVDVMHEFESMKNDRNNANEGACHYSYAPMTFSVIEELSERLPEYTDDVMISDYINKINKSIEFEGDTYNDDRMYIFYICKCTINTEEEKTCYTIHHNKPPTKYKWCLVTFRNTERYPAIGVDSFESWDDAIEYSNNAEPTTPLISLGGRVPDKILPIDEYRSWKAKNNFQKYNYRKMYMTESQGYDTDYAETICR